VALGYFRRRPLAALQVEVSSRCTRRCVICPRTPLASVWTEGDLGDATWRRLRDDLKLAKHVHLQGWGEPLLHPRLPEMVDAAMAAGCTVGLTTNADLLPEAVDWIVDAGVSQVIVSVAGNESTHAELRDGSRLTDVWAAVEQLSRRRGKGRKPRIKIGYLLTRTGSGQLLEAIRSAADVGADEIFATHLDCTPSPELAAESAFDSAGLSDDVASVLDAAEQTARSAGIPFRSPTRAPEELLVCASDPLHCVYVGWDGRVGPCVNLVLPVTGRIPRWHGNECGHIGPTIFGRLPEQSLREILSGPASYAFTSTFENRLAAERRLFDVIIENRGGGAIARLEDADRQRIEDLEANPFPAACAGCHKVLGW